MVNVFALAFLYKGSQVLLAHRHNATYGQGMYSLIGGKVEAGETALQAIVREVKEEIGLTIPAKDFTLVHTLHRKGTETEFIAVCFKADMSHMPAPTIAEPDKHDDIRFFDIHALPENILPAHKQIIECIEHRVPYSEHGW